MKLLLIGAASDEENENELIYELDGIKLLLAGAAELEDGMALLDEEPP